MSTYGVSTKELARRGRVATDGDSMPGRPRSAAMDAGRSDIGERLPSFIPLHGGFTVIPVTSFAVASGLSAWYGLAVVNIPDDVAQEIQFANIKCELHSCDPDAHGAGTGASSALAWGTDAGMGAAIVVGERLGLTQNAWTTRPCAVPGVEASSLVSSPRSPYLWSLKFPPGKWGGTSSAAATRLVVTHAVVPFARRLVRGTTLEIGLVVRGSQMNAKTGNLCGFAHVEVFAGATVNPRALDQ